MNAVSHRLSAEKSTHWYYEQKFRWSVNCTYCGMPADTKDHVFPLSIAAMLDLTRAGVRKSLGQGLCCVPCCRECNSLAGREPFTSIQAKRDYIQAKLRKRLAMDLASQDWDPQELAEMGRTLRLTIMKGIRARLRAEMRCNWPHARDAKGRRIR